MSIIAHSAEDRAQQLLSLTQRLNARITEECAAYEVHRPQDIFEKVEETRTLSSLYGLEMSRIKANPKLLEGISHPVKTALKLETQKFQALMERYTRLVSVAKTVSEGIMKSMVVELQKSNPQPVGYNPNGVQARAGLNSMNYGARV